MPRNSMTEVKCPKCGEVRVEDRARRKICSACIETRDRERRLDTMRKPATRPYCDICVEDAKFEYYLLPDRSFRRTNRKSKEWCVLCDLCFNTWLESGSHRKVHLSTRSPQSGPPNRPLMQDELDVVRASSRASIDRSTGLFTYDWRRP